MGVMKRIATERQWNADLEGAETDPEVAAMKRLHERCERDRRRPAKRDDKQGRLFR